MTHPHIRLVVAVLGTVAAFLTAAVSAQGAAAHLAASPAGGARQQVPGDFDGDGHADLAVGAPGVDRVRVTYTRASVNGSHTARLGPDSRPAEHMSFGDALSVGDVNHDGYADLLVAAPQYTAAHRVGAVFLFLGSAHGLHKTPLHIVGPDPSDSDIDFANSIAVASADLNHDGYADVAVATASSVRIYHGSTDGLRRTGFTKLHIDGGETLAIGDLNGDGRPDLVIGREVGDIGNRGDEFGQLDVFDGTAHGLTAKRYTITGNHIGEGADASFEGFGAAIVTGDFNGDGYADVAAGVPGGDEAGYPATYSGNIVVLFGSADGLKSTHRQVFNETSIYIGMSDSDDFGGALAAGRITAGPFSDLVVGDPGSTVHGKASAGAVYVIHGSEGGLTAAKAQRLTQATPGVPGTAHADTQFGTAVYVADLAGSARLDLVIGAPLAVHPGHQSGSIVRLLGTSQGVTTDNALQEAMSTSGAEFGSAVG